MPAASPPASPPAPPPTSPPAAAAPPWHYYCTGFIAARSHALTVRLIEQWARELSTPLGQLNQPAFNRVLYQATHDPSGHGERRDDSRGGGHIGDGPAEVLRHAPLSSALFPNGKQFFVHGRGRHGRSAEPPPVHPVVVHNNFIAGLRPKVERFSRAGLWLPHARNTSRACTVRV